jgi:peptide methionine sulfoxide reductase MsrB
VRGKQAFNLSLEDDRQLERHLATVLTDKQRSMQDRRKAINSILLRFVSVNKVLFPEFEQCEFPRSYSPA